MKTLGPKEAELRRLRELQADSGKLPHEKARPAQVAEGSAVKLAKRGPRCTTCKGRGVVRDATSAKSATTKPCPACKGGWTEMICSRCLGLIQDSSSHVQTSDGRVYHLCDCKPLTQRFRSGSCEGERCFCGDAADHKVEETIFHDDPLPHRHPLTAYICHEHFKQIMGPMAEGR